MSRPDRLLPPPPPTEEAFSLSFNRPIQKYSTSATFLFYASERLTTDSLSLCLAVQTSDVCPPDGRVSIATPQSGHLMMKAPDHVLRTAGTTSCPWTISVDPHQKLRFYLLSFGSELQASTVGACSRFVVFEESRRTQERLCRAPVRQTLLYTSTTNRVSVSQTIGVPEKWSSSIVYMLQYEGL